MVTNKNGNLLESDVDIIAHQTNCLGIMGGGIALQIRNIFPGVFNKYVSFCNTHGDDNILGLVQYIQTKNKFGEDKIVANMFSQYGVGGGVQTNYAAIKNCFEDLKRVAEEKNMTIGIPHKIGCGLAGGDWNIVLQIIDEVFGDSDVELYIYKYEV